MSWDRFDREMTTYTVTGKGDYTATLPVHPKFREHLDPLPTRWRFLFPGKGDRDHVTPEAIWNWIWTVGEFAGIAQLRPHQLRHYRDGAGLAPRRDGRPDRSTTRRDLR